MGRYFFRSPTTIPADAFKAPPEDLLLRLKVELAQGAQTLVDLIERDCQQQLRSSGRSAKVSSLYIVGGNVAGLVSPEHLVYPGADIISISGVEIVFRHAGNPTAPGPSGGLLFGVHHFLRNQQNVFEMQ